MIGMMWYDNDAHKSLADKIRQAAEYYQSKYGAQPNLALVSLKEDELPAIDGISVKASKSVLKNNVWIGRQS